MATFFNIAHNGLCELHSVYRMDGTGRMDHTPLTVTTTNNLNNFDLDSSGL